MTQSDTRLRIPQSEIQYFKQIISTDIEKLDRVAAYLLKAKPRLDVNDLSGEVASETGMELDKVDSLISFLWRLLLVKRRFDLSLPGFMRDISQVLDKLAEDVWSEEDRNEWEKRREVVSKLLDTHGALGYGAKAAELLFEQPLVLCESRIISDMRPIFDDDANNIQAFVNFHTLILRCLEGNEERVIHIAMDNNDVSQLKEHAERAEKKTKAIDAEFRDKDVNIIALEEKKEK